MGVLFEVKLFQEFFGQSCITTMHYTTTSIPAVVTRSFALAAAMGFVDGIVPPGDNVYNRWKAKVTDDVYFREVQVRAIYDVVDFYVQPLTIANQGSSVGESSSPVIAYGFQSSRVRQDIRRGNRRLVGVPASGLDEGGVISAATLTSLEVLSDAFGAVLGYDDEGNTVSFNPVIVSKELYTTPAGNDAYKYYATEAEQLQHIASGILWAALPTVRTQTSRQYGRGI